MEYQLELDDLDRLPGNVRDLVFEKNSKQYIYIRSQYDFYSMYVHGIQFGVHRRDGEFVLTIKD